MDARCVRATFSAARSVLAHEYLADTMILEFRDQLAPIIGDTTSLPGHPRRLLVVRGRGAPPVDYAAWWPHNPDSLDLMWRFGINRAVFVRTAVDTMGGMNGRMFLTAGVQREGPLAFAAKRVACFGAPA